MDVTNETVSGTTEERHSEPGRSGRRHRRPSGEAPPLPHVLGRSGKFWIVMVLYFLSLLIGVTFFQPLGGIFDRFDTLRLRWIANLPDPQIAATLVQEANLSPLIAGLLARRGITTAAAAAEYLNPAISRLHSPSPKRSEWRMPILLWRSGPLLRLRTVSK